MPNIEYLLPNIGRTAAPGDAPGEELPPTRGPPPSVPPTRSLCDCSSVHAEHDVPAASLLGSGDTWGSHPALCNPPLGGCSSPQPRRVAPSLLPPPPQPLHLSRCQPGDWETSMLD